MNRICATNSAEIDAPPDVVYGILADYREGHPRILPPKAFVGLEVESGGYGAGTVVLVTMRAFGGTRRMRMDVTEPEPGRTLAETEAATSTVTNFVVEPLDGGRRSRVTITTEWPPRGLRGMVERLLAPQMLHGIYADELERLRSLALERATDAAAARARA